MNEFLCQKKAFGVRKVIATLILVAFFFNMITPAGAQLLPVPGTMVGLTAGFQPPVLLGLKIHPENPLLFDFIVDQGASKLSQDELKSETEKLVKYFLAALTIPDKEVWVNLSPYEKDRIIPDVLGQTTMGKTMLEQDYMLKQLASSLTNPDEKMGQEFWAKVKTQVQSKLGTTDIPMSTFNKVWIVPQKAEVLESNGIVLVGAKRLKLMMNEDYVAMDKNQQSANSKAKDVSSISSAIFKDTILPNIEKEINEGKNFANVRQIYNSVILAAWYKKALKESLLGKVYTDKGKVAGVENDDKDIKQKIYEQYLAAFKKGVYNLIKEDTEATMGDAVPRKYFSGGAIMGLNVAGSAVLEERAISMGQIQEYVEAAGSTVVAEVYAATAVNERAAVAGSSVLANTPSPVRPVILVFEASGDVRNEFVAQLVSQGYEVRTADNLEQAKAELAKPEISLVTMTKALTEYDLTGFKTDKPVILMTANGNSISAVLKQALPNLQGVVKRDYTRSFMGPMRDKIYQSLFQASGFQISNNPMRLLRKTNTFVPQQTADEIFQDITKVWAKQGEQDASVKKRNYRALIDLAKLLQNNLYTSDAIRTTFPNGPASFADDVEILTSQFPSINPESASVVEIFRNAFEFLSDGTVDLYDPLVRLPEMLSNAAYAKMRSLAAEQSDPFIKDMLGSEDTLRNILWTMQYDTYNTVARELGEAAIFYEFAGNHLNYAKQIQAAMIVGEKVLGLTSFTDAKGYNAWGLNLGTATNPRWANYDDLVAKLQSEGIFDPSKVINVPAASSALFDKKAIVTSIMSQTGFTDVDYLNKLENNELKTMFAHLQQYPPLDNIGVKSSVSNGDVHVSKVQVGDETLTRYMGIRADPLNFNGHRTLVGPVYVSQPVENLRDIGAIQYLPNQVAVTLSSSAVTQLITLQTNKTISGDVSAAEGGNLFVALPNNNEWGYNITVVGDTVNIVPGFISDDLASLGKLQGIKQGKLNEWIVYSKETFPYGLAVNITPNSQGGFSYQVKSIVTPITLKEKEVRQGTAEDGKEIFVVLEGSDAAYKVIFSNGEYVISPVQSTNIGFENLLGIRYGSLDKPTTYRPDNATAGIHVEVTSDDAGRYQYAISVSKDFKQLSPGGAIGIDSFLDQASNNLIVAITKSELEGSGVASFKEFIPGFDGDTGERTYQEWLFKLGNVSVIGPDLQKTYLALADHYRGQPNPTGLLEDFRYIVKLTGKSVAASSGVFALKVTQVANRLEELKTGQPKSIQDALTPETVAGVLTDIYKLFEGWDSKSNEPWAVSFNAEGPGSYNLQLARQLIASKIFGMTEQVPGKYEYQLVKYEAIARLKFSSEVGSNVDAILSELIKNGFLEELSPAEVRLKVNLDQNKVEIRRIAQGDSEKILAILQESQVVSYPRYSKFLEEAQTAGYVLPSLGGVDEAKIRAMEVPFGEVISPADALKVIRQAGVLGPVTRTLGSPIPLSAALGLTKSINTGKPEQSIKYGIDILQITQKRIEIEYRTRFDEYGSVNTDINSVVTGARTKLNRIMIYRINERGDSAAHTVAEQKLAIALEWAKAVGKGEFISREAAELLVQNAIDHPTSEILPNAVFLTIMEANKRDSNLYRGERAAILEFAQGKLQGAQEQLQAAEADQLAALTAEAEQQRQEELRRAEAQRVESLQIAARQEQQIVAAEFKLQRDAVALAAKILTGNHRNRLKNVTKELDPQDPVFRYLTDADIVVFLSLLKAKSGDGNQVLRYNLADDVRASDLNREKILQARRLIAQAFFMNPQGGDTYTFQFLVKGKKGAPDFTKNATFNEFIENLEGFTYVKANAKLPDFQTASSAASAPTNILEQPVGGIDFDPTNMNLQIKRNGKGVPLPLPQQNLDQINIQGLFPVIINIVPVNAQTLPIFLGQAPKEPGREPELAASTAS